MNLVNDSHMMFGVGYDNVEHVNHDEPEDDLYLLTSTDADTQVDKSPVGCKSHPQRLALNTQLEITTKGLKKH